MYLLPYLLYRQSASNHKVEYSRFLILWFNWHITALGKTEPKTTKRCIRIEPRRSKKNQTYQKRQRFFRTSSVDSLKDRTIYSQSHTRIFQYLHLLQMQCCKESNFCIYVGREVEWVVVWQRSLVGRSAVQDDNDLRSNPAMLTSTFYCLW